MAHNWIKSTLGHGETMCSRCHITNREAAALGQLNECSAMTSDPAGWQTRETMPSDGREVLMYSPEQGMAVWPSTAGWSHVTHWMPLPTTPTTTD